MSVYKRMEDGSTVAKLCWGYYKPTLWGHRPVNAKNWQNKTRAEAVTLALAHLAFMEARTKVEHWCCQVNEQDQEAHLLIKFRDYVWEDQQ